MAPELIILMMFVALIVALMLGIPIGFGMGIIGLVVLYYLFGPRGLPILVYDTFSTMWSDTYIAIPQFIFMGILLEHSGLAEALFETIHRWSGRIRGGLGIGTVVICTLFAAMTGTNSAATITMGLIAVPAMLRRGYDKTLAVGIVGGAGTLGILIPPSINMIIFASVADVSVGKMFVGGILPGLMLSVLFMLYIGIRGILQPHLCPAHGAKFTLREKITSSKIVIAPALIIFSVLGAIFFGIATPTEASAVGAAAVMISAATQRRFSRQVAWKSIISTLRLTGMCLWLMFGALCFTSGLFSAGGVPVISKLMLGLTASPMQMVILVLGIVFILGCFIDNWAITFIVIPVAMPILRSLGVDPIWFGVIFIEVCLTGLLTPPFGYSLFYLRAVLPPQQISTMDIYRAIIPFVGIIVLGVAITLLFPQIITWLPEVMLRMRG